MSKAVTLMFLLTEFWRSETVETADRRCSPQLRTAHRTPSFSYSVGTAPQPPWNSWALTHAKVPDLSAVMGSVMDGKRRFPLQNRGLETPKPGSESPGSPGCLQRAEGARNHRQLPAVSRLLSQRPRIKKQGPVPSEASSQDAAAGTPWPQPLHVIL